MSIVADVLRPFWLIGLNEVAGRTDVRLRGWVASGNYQIHSVVNKNEFKLHFFDSEPIVRAFACDCMRMTISSFESIDGIVQHSKIPKSTAWLIIRLYYSAFYAAHATLRMFGISCTQFDADQVRMINKIAKLFNSHEGVDVSSGFYKCLIKPNSKEVLFKKLDNKKGGSHEHLWKVFYVTLKNISNEVLLGPGRTIDNQNVSRLLSEICENLSHGNCPSGNWLSFVRNKTTYRLNYGTWFPYKGALKDNKELFRKIPAWLSDPSKMYLRTQAGQDLKKFVETCCAIIAICRVLTIDMNQRCPKGKSFHSNGAISLLKKLEIEC
jgi:hypothetical protein